LPEQADARIAVSRSARLFCKAARGAGLRDFNFHDLRHHGATMALNRGFTALGGWKTERMMRRYAAVTDQHYGRRPKLSRETNGPSL
jgi:integrase